MSWYNNNNESAFQDATQIQLGGSGSSSSTTIVQNGDSVGIGGGGGGNTGTDTTISDLISLRYDNPNYNVYITNNNTNGKIYFRTVDNNNKIKIENGKLYVWYDYNPFISLLILSGWTHISDYIVTTRQGQLNNAVNIGVLDVAILAPGTGLISRVTVMEPILASTTANSIENTGRIVRLETAFDIDEPTDLEFENALDSGIDQLRQELGTKSNNFMDMIKNSAYQGGNARNLSNLIRKSNYSLAQSFFTNLFAAIGGLSFVVGISYQIYDRWRDNKLYDEEKNLIITYEKIKDETDASVANLIHKNGLIITQSTNNNFINAGTYEVNTSNNCVLIIIIKSVSGTLTAEIDSVKETDTGFAVNNVISIPKSSIGGTTGNLEIVVSTLYSEVQILAFDLDLITEERDQLVNRNRRRKFIPDKNDFGNGLNITETNNTEPSGEITKALDISLKLDTSQFAYDGSGNLQLTNYNNLIYTSANGTVGINTTTPDAFIKLHCKGSGEFGDGVNINQTINIKSLNGYYICGTNNSGNGTNNNQFYIYDANDLAYRLTIQNGTGRVGIGTAAPGYKLDVNGDVNIGSLAKYKIGGNDLSYSDLAGTPPTSSQWTTNGNDIHYSTGTVGINISSPNTSYKLDVNGSINIFGAYYINGYAQASIQGIDTTLMTLTGAILSIKPEVQSKWTTNGNDIYYSIGSVGINKSSPSSSYKLDVNGSVNITGSYHLNGTTLLGITGIDTSLFSLTSGTLSIHPTQQQKWTAGPGNDIYYNASNGRVGIGISPTHELHVLGNALVTGNQSVSGNLGVGILSPNEKLDVVGDSKFTGDQYITGQVGIGVATPGTNTKLDIKDSYSVTANGNGDGIITIRGAIGAGRGGTATHGKQGLYVAHVNGTQGVSIGFAGVAQTGSSNVPLLLYGKSTDVIKMINGAGSDIFIFRSNGDVAFDGNIVSLPSDIRIKENIREIDDKEALNKILALQPKKYEYIDKKARGDKTVIGFIAQQVREVIPEAVQIDKKVIANVLKWCDYNAGKIFINIDDVTIGTRINIRYNDEITEGDTGDTFKIKSIHDDYVELDDEDGMKKIPDNMDRVFVHGHEINDFHYLDKNAIYTHNVSATQELYKIIMQQQEQIDMLKEILARNNIL